MTRIAVLTSGGDAAGMNAAIRAVTRSALSRDWEVDGIRDGYRGLLEESFEHLGWDDVGGILQLGGTVLGSARCPEFRDERAQQRAVDALRARNIQGLVVVGGNGSQAGAHAVSRQGFPVVGIASTIDNDLVGSDITLGVDTALNVAIEAVDRLKTTATSHRRAFLVEVMGRDCGYLALATGIASGAEVVVIPEVNTEPAEVAGKLRDAYERGNSHAVVIVAEGARHGSEELLTHFDTNEQELGFPLRATILGHVQRGGAPGAFDRLLGTRLGTAAVDKLATGRHGVLVGLVSGETATTPLGEVVGNTKGLDPQLLDVADQLVR